MDSIGREYTKLNPYSEIRNNFPFPKNWRKTEYAVKKKEKANINGIIYRCISSLWLYAYIKKRYALIYHNRNSKEIFGYHEKKVEIIFAPRNPRNMKFIHFGIATGLF